jgi:hypothetical protein
MKQLGLYVRNLKPDNADFEQWLALLAQKIELVKAWQRHELMLYSSWFGRF